MNPDDLAAEPVWRAEWADMKYGWPHKFYVDIANREPAALFVVSSTNGDVPKVARDLIWVAAGDLTREQRRIVKRDGWSLDRATFVGFGTRSHHFGKFYTTHLADPTLDPAVKATIEQRSGLRFTFADGRVSWAGVDR